MSLLRSRSCSNDPSTVINAALPLDSVAQIKRDLAVLSGLTLLLVATGIGLRDPWPADEPRFALIARDMLASGDWLVPRVGGDIYADKPPLFFWLIALCLKVTGSLRVAFLLPSLTSALACVALVYDLGRRLWGRETGLIAGLTLLCTVQFVWQARQAQIDATLCFWTTLSLYALLRHLLLGPQWRWYAIGWAAAGLGVITKGVGFLPLLVLLPFALLRAPQWRPRTVAPSSARWLLGPLAFIAAVGIWLGPMLWAAASDPTLANYRDEILFHQTIDRYSDAWHHHEPLWYFIVNVIPVSWLPWTVLLPWLIPRWRNAVRLYDLPVALLLSWIALVVLFFSLSAGKRGVYVLPAVPALALVCAPFLREISREVWARRAILAVAGSIPLICTVASGWLLLVPHTRTEVIERYALDPLPPLAVLSLVAAATCWLLRRHSFPAFAGTLTVVLLIVSFWINPAMNEMRSGSNFVRKIEQQTDRARELAIAGFQEQYLLHVSRPVVHFGHARWRERDRETFDAALWLDKDPERQLIIRAAAARACFSNAVSSSLGVANRSEWLLISGHPDPHCAARGSDTAMSYTPPHLNVR